MSDQSTIEVRVRVSRELAQDASDAVLTQMLGQIVVERLVKAPA
jgi:hypothetical protein